MAVSQIGADGENAEYENTISVAGGPEVETGIAGRECQRLGLTRFYLALCFGVLFEDTKTEVQDTEKSPHSTSGRLSPILPNLVRALSEVNARNII